MNYHIEYFNNILNSLIHLLICIAAENSKLAKKFNTEATTEALVKEELGDCTCSTWAFLPFIKVKLVVSKILQYVMQ